MTQSRVLIINGSYRKDGFTDQAVSAVVDTLREAGAKARVVNLREYPIEFCTNCRECALQPGESPGHCVLDDGMHDLIAEIEAADALVLAAPTNFSSVTAIFKRFMERLMPYAWWPWERPWPVPRRSGPPRKKALLISSSAAPAWFGRLAFGSTRQLAMVARTLGAKPVGRLFTGRAANHPEQKLSAASGKRARRLARRLIAD